MDWIGRSNLELNLDHVVSIFEEYPFQSRDVIVSLLRSAELEDDAWEYLDFVPVAYFRVLMRPSGLMFPDTFILHDGDAPPQARRFDEYAIYQEALRHAAASFLAGMTQENIESVIWRSCEFPAINRQLRTGIGPGRVQALSPHISTGCEDLSEGADVAAPIPVDEGPGQWWEFWKK